ncbi:MAG TPA: LytR C-terminal domain-containing protein [Syntrophales bacterium]|nr:LytR C-terminal domain-containing protein [Syntrophales bacterium]
MFIRSLYIFTLVFCLFISGCSTLGFFDKSSKDDLERSKASIAHLNDQLTDLNKELVALKKEVQQLKEETQKEKEEVEEETGTSDEEKIQEEVIRSKAEKKKPIEEEPAIRQKEIDVKTIKVKVLSGNGKLSSARDMSKKLIRMGYQVTDIGLGPRKDFTANTIYFASNYQREAQQLAARLGGKTVCKPLTWNSIYNIIVVAVP